MRGLFGALARKSYEVGPSSGPFSALIDGTAFSKAGTSVTAEKSLQVTTVLGCVRVLAEGVASLPFRVYEQTGPRDRRTANDHAVHKILRRRPNDWQTPFEWREGMMIHALLNDGGYSLVNRVAGKVREVIPLVSSSVKAEQKPDYSLVYKVALPGGDTLELPKNQVFHLRGPSWDGYRGLEAVKLAREAIGLAMATEESHSRLHSNGARPGGVLVSDTYLNNEQIAELRDAWQATQGGVANAMKTAILGGGLKWTPLAMSGVDSQHIETRKHQIEEICRAFRVMPIMLGHPADLAARAAVEQMFLAHVIHSLGPWIDRFEQVCNRDLLTEKENDSGFYTKMSVQGLLRGAAKDRAEFYAKALGSGGSPAWMTQDEVRALEELPPKGGDTDELPRPTNPGTPEAGDGEGDDPDNDSGDAPGDEEDGQT